ncbi:hypothetical protein SDJN03_02645, partial [Cucurbita argyrosperma subsp. sororia]
MILQQILTLSLQSHSHFLTIIDYRPDVCCSSPSPCPLPPIQPRSCDGVASSWRFQSNSSLLHCEEHAAMDAALCVDVHAPLLAENQFTITTLLDSHYVNISYEKSHHKYLSELQFQQMEKDAGSDVLSFKQNAIADRPSRKCFQQTEWAINHVPCPCLSKSHVQAVIWHWRLDPHIINGCDSASAKEENKRTAPSRL